MAQRTVLIKITVDVEEKKAKKALEDLAAEAAKASKSVDELGNEAKGADGSLDELGNSAKGAEAPVKGLGDAATGAGDSIVGIGKASKPTVADLAALVVVANQVASVFKGAFNQGLQAFLGLESGLNTFRAVTGATAEDVDKVANRVEQLGIQSTKTPAELSNLTAELGRMGFNADDVDDSLGALVSASEATGESLSNVGQIIGLATLQFGESADQSQRFADVLVATANSSATGIGQLGESLKLVGPSAAAANQDIENVSAALGVLANAGLSGSIAGTSLGKAFQSLQAPTAGAMNQIKALNLEVRDAEGQLLPLPDLVANVEAGLAGLGQEARDAALSDIFGVQGGRAFTALLAEGADGLRELDTSLRDVNGASQASADVLLQGLGGALTLLDGSLETLSASLFSFVAGPVEAVVRAITSVINAVISAPEPIRALITGIAASVGVVAAGVAALGGLAGAIGLVQVAITAAAPILAGLAGTAAAAAAPFVAAGAAIAAVGVAVALLANQLRQNDEFMERIGRSFGLIRKAVSELVSQIRDALTPALQLLEAAFGATASTGGLFGLAIDALAFGLGNAIETTRLTIEFLSRLASTLIEVNNRINPAVIALNALNEAMGRNQQSAARAATALSQEFGAAMTDLQEGGTLSSERLRELVTQIEAARQAGTLTAQQAQMMTRALMEAGTAANAAAAEAESLAEAQTAVAETALTVAERLAQQEAVLRESLAAQAITQEEFETQLLAIKREGIQAQLDAAKAGSEEESKLRGQLADLTIAEQDRATKAAIASIKQEEQARTQVINTLQAQAAQRKAQLDTEVAGLQSILALSQQQFRISQLENEQSRIAVTSAIEALDLEIKAADTERERLALEQQRSVQVKERQRLEKQALDEQIAQRNAQIDQEEEIARIQFEQQEIQEELAVLTAEQNLLKATGALLQAQAAEASQAELDNLRQQVEISGLILNTARQQQATSGERRETLEQTLTLNRRQLELETQIARAAQETSQSSERFEQNLRSIATEGRTVAQIAQEIQSQLGVSADRALALAQGLAGAKSEAQGLTEALKAAGAASAAIKPPGGLGGLASLTSRFTSTRFASDRQLTESLSRLLKNLIGQRETVATPTINMFGQRVDVPGVSSALEQRIEEVRAQIASLRPKAKPPKPFTSQPELIVPANIVPSNTNATQEAADTSERERQIAAQFAEQQRERDQSFNAQQRELEQAFNAQQQTQESAFNDRQRSEQLALEDSIRERRSKLEAELGEKQKEIERQLQLEFAGSDKAREELETRFAQEDAIAQRREALERPLREAREKLEAEIAREQEQLLQRQQREQEAFEAQQKADVEAFALQQQQNEAAFKAEQNRLDLTAQQNLQQNQAAFNQIQRSLDLDTARQIQAIASGSAVGASSGSVAPSVTVNTPGNGDVVAAVNRLTGIVERQAVEQNNISQRELVS